MTNDLPFGWTWATLGEIGRYLNGRAFKATDWKEQGRPIIRIQNLTGSSRHHNHYQGEVEDRHLVRNGDLLLSWAATLGVFVWRGEEAVLNQHIFKVESWISRSFHRWLLKFVLDDLYRQAHGSGMVHITKRKFDATPVPIPPLAEQERIVAAIEEHFSRLAAVDANLRSVARRIEMLEQAVIDQAMKGEVHRLGDRLSEPLRNGFSPPRSSAGNTRVLTLTAVTKRAFTEENTRTAAVPQTQRDRLTLQPGDILVQRSNTPELVGTAALYSGPSGWAVFPDLLIRVRTDHTLLPTYLELALRSSDVRRYFRLSAQGIAGSMPKISQSTIEELEIPIPASIAEQRAIARRVSTEVQAVTGVRSGVRTASKRADALRRAVLGAAFAGQLVPQNPSDEPAPVLLERIAASRTARPKRQKVRA